MSAKVSSERMNGELTEVVVIIVIDPGVHHIDRPPSRHDGDDYAERHCDADADFLESFDSHSPGHQPGEQGDDEVGNDIIYFRTDDSVSNMDSTIRKILSERAARGRPPTVSPHLELEDLVVRRTHTWYLPPVYCLPAVVCPLQEEGDDEIYVERGNDEPKSPSEPPGCDSRSEQRHGECCFAPGLANHSEDGRYGNEDEHPVIPRLGHIASSKLDAYKDASH